MCDFYGRYDRRQLIDEYLIKTSNKRRALRNTYIGRIIYNVHERVSLLVEC